MNGSSVKPAQHVEAACAVLKKNALSVKNIGVRRGKFYPGPRRDVRRILFSPIYRDNVALLRSRVVPLTVVVKGGLA